MSDTGYVVAFNKYQFVAALCHTELPYWNLSTLSRVALMAQEMALVWNCSVCPQSMLRAGVHHRRALCTVPVLGATPVCVYRGCYVFLLDHTAISLVSSNRWRHAKRHEMARGMKCVFHLLISWQLKHLSPLKKCWEGFGAVELSSEPSLLFAFSVPLCHTFESCLNYITSIFCC